MARITSEDCTRVISNRFELILCAALRARDLSSGAQITVAKNKDRFSVIALREIAENNLNLDILIERVKRYFVYKISHSEEEPSEELLESEALLAQEVFDEIRRNKEDSFLFEDDED